MPAFVVVVPWQNGIRTKSAVSRHPEYPPEIPRGVGGWEGLLGTKRCRREGQDEVHERDVNVQERDVSRGLGLTCGRVVF